MNFSVNVASPGPYTYLWQFNGANIKNANIIYTVAGNGVGSFGGDGGPATIANIKSAYGVAFDSVGNMYVADSGNNRVRKLDTNGTITTVAGNGGTTFSGDGVIATNTSVWRPSGVTVDAAGNLYVADYNNRIRKVDTNGYISTVAGGGTGGDGGPATSASLNNPTGIALDGVGNLYIADRGNNRVRRVDTSGNINAFAGTNSAGFAGDGGLATYAKLSSPTAVATDAAGNVFIADSVNNRVREVNVSGIITTFAGTNVSGFAGDGGAATNARLNNPTGVAVDISGDVFVLDASNNRIRMIDTNGSITTVAGSGNPSYGGDGGAATNAGLFGPQGVALDVSGNLYIGDNGNRVRKVLLYASLPAFTISHAAWANAGNYSVAVTGSAGSVTSSVASLTVLSPPIITAQPMNQMAAIGGNSTFTVGVGGTGPFGYSWWLGGTNLVQSGPSASLTLSGVSVNDSGNNYSVVITNIYGSVTSSVATLTVGLAPRLTLQPVNQTLPTGTNANFTVMAGGTGPFSYQWQWNGTNLPNNIITTVAGNGTGTFAGDGLTATNASLDFPEGICLDAVGNLYIADHGNHRVRRVDTNGVITTLAGTGVSIYSGDGGAATNAGMKAPSSVAMDSAGNLYVADETGDSIRRVDANGFIATVAGNGVAGSAGDSGPATNANFGGSYGVVLDAAGELFISDEGSGHGRIRKVNTSGVINTIAGMGTLSPAVADGGPAILAGLPYPTAEAWDAAGNLYVADWTGGRIRKVSTSGIISTVAGGGSLAPAAADGGAATNASIGPLGVAVDVFGNVYIGDFNNQSVRKVDTNGIITTAAGGGTGGDGGAATNASMSATQGVTFDSAGNLFISEFGKHRIREVHYAGFPYLALPNVGATNNGDYSVVISSPYGSVTSSVVVLTVFPPPTVQIANLGSGQFGLTWNAASNVNYQLQYATNLLAPGWVNLGAPVTATNSSAATTDLPGADIERFYRLMVVP